MTTKAERKTIRKQNRELRKKLKKERKTGFNAILTAVGNSNITIDLDNEEPKFAEAFNQVWPLLKPILAYAELIKITGSGADKVLHTAIELGERIANGSAGTGEQSAFISTLDMAWQPVKGVLGILVTFTDDRVDRVLNQIIEIGDWITEDKSV